MDYYSKYVQTPLVNHGLLLQVCSGPSGKSLCDFDILLMVFDSFSYFASTIEILALPSPHPSPRTFYIVSLIVSLQDPYNLYLTYHNLEEKHSLLILNSFLGFLWPTRKIQNLPKWHNEVTNFHGQYYLQSNVCSGK